MREQVYARTVFFVRNQGFVEPTAARRISFADSLAFEDVHERTYRELGFRLIEVPAGPLPAGSRPSSGSLTRRQPSRCWDNPCYLRVREAA